jgi:hypothetical protein
MTDQFINRSSLTENFTVLPNALLNDARVSSEGLALMVYLLSKPLSWQLSPAEIRKRFKWGKDKAYKVISALIECGYIIKDTQRNGGKYASHVYFVYDTPQIPPFPEKPEPVKPEPVNQDTIKNRDTNCITIEERTDSYKSDEWFEKFWKIVAHKQAKPQCKAKFLRACKDTDPALIVKVYEQQLQSHRSKGKGVEYFRRPLTWLNQEAWHDPIEAKDSTGADARAGRVHARVRHWLKNKYWNDEWGFPPDHPAALTETKTALKELQHG